MKKTNQKRTTPNVSIIIIFDQLRIVPLTRLLEGIKPQLATTAHDTEVDTEVLLIHESNSALACPKLPVKVRYITIPEKQGIPFNRNQGIKHAKGDIIVFIDDDCWVQDKWLSSLLKSFNDPSVMAATSSTKIPPSNWLGDSISALGFPGGGSLGFEKIWRVSPTNMTNHLAVGNCALRRELFDKIGLFDEKMKTGAEDAELSWRMEKAGIPIRYVPEAYAFHEARTTWDSFVKWQLRRGRANYHFKEKVGSIDSFIKLRLWSTKNILQHNLFRFHLLLVLFLLGASFWLQKRGYNLEKKCTRSRICPTK